MKIHFLFGTETGSAEMLCEDIRAALIQLAGQSTIDHIKLEHCMTWRQRHFFDLTHIPGRHHKTSRVRIRFDLLQHPADLINVSSVGSGPGAPLIAVNGTQVAVFVGPLVPDRHTIFVERMNVRITFQKPEQFADN